MVERIGNDVGVEFAGREPEAAPILVAQAETLPAEDAAPVTETAAVETRIVVEIDETNSLRLPATASVDQPRVNGTDLEFVQADGSVIVVPNGAIQGLTIFIGNVEIPPQTVAALFDANGIQAAAGPAGAGERSSGGNFEVPVGGIGDAFDIGDLLDPTALAFTEPTFDDQFAANTPPQFSLGSYDFRLSEEGFGLADSGPNSLLDTTNATSFSVQLGINDLDGDDLTFSLGQPNIELRSNGELIQWSGVGTDTMVGRVGDTVIIEISIGGENATLTVTLRGPVDHPGQDIEDVLNLGFTVTASDGRGGTATANINLGLEDDAPEIGTPQSGNVDEDGLAGGVGNDDSLGDNEGNSASGSGSLDIRWGGDNGSNRAVYFSEADFAAFETDNAALSSGGQALDFLISDDRTTITATLPDGTPIFRVTLSEEGNGSYSFELLGKLDHAAPGSEGVATENDIVLRFDFTAQDADGDRVRGEFDVTVDDDMPVLTTPEGYESVRTIDEDDIRTDKSLGTSPNDGDADGSFTGNPLTNDRGPAFLSGSFAGAVDFGADGADGYAINGDAVTTFIGYDLSSKGVDLAYSSTTSADGAWSVFTATAGDRTVFEFRVNTETGAYEFRLYDQLDHKAPTSGADQNFDLGAISGLDFGAIVRAFDGDRDFVDLDGKLTIQVRDDVPELVRGRTETQIVDEAEIRTGLSTGTDPDFFSDDFYDGNNSYTGSNGAATVTGSLAHLVRGGADDALKFGFVGEAELRATLSDLGLKSDGRALSYDLQGNVLYGFANQTGIGEVYNPGVDRPVFKLTLNEDGSYRFELIDQLDHDKPSSGADQNFGFQGSNNSSIDFGAIIKATDADGDSVVLRDAFDIAIKDDVPELVRGASEIQIVDEQEIRTGLSTGTDPDFFPDDRFDGNDSYTGYNGAATVTGSLGHLVRNGADDNLQFSFVSANAARAALAALNLHSNGRELSFEIEGNQIVGFVNKTGTGTQFDLGEDRPVFRLTLTENGSYRFELIDQLDHDKPSSGADQNFGLQGSNNSSIDFGAIIKATDADGDSVVLRDAFKIAIKDDVPELISGKEVYGVVEEEQLYGGNEDASDKDGFDNDQKGPPANYNATTTVFTGSGNSSLAALVAGGADDTGKFSARADALYSAVRAENDTIIKSEGKTVEIKSIETGSDGEGRFTIFTAKADGREVFTLKVYEDGDWRFELKDQIDHQGDGKEDFLALDLARLVQFVDADGDTINLGRNSFVIKVVDDTPLAPDSTTVWLDDDNLKGGNPDGVDDNVPANQTGFLNHSFGADGGGGSISWLANSVTHAGVEGIAYSVSTDGKTMQISQFGKLVATAVLDAKTGAYSITQNAAIKHPAGANENDAVFELKYQVKDGDGDIAVSRLWLKIDDDTPTAPDSTTVWLDDDTLNGGNAGGVDDNAPANQTGILNHSFGADAEGGSISWLASSVTHAGVEGITYSVSTDGKTMEIRQFDKVVATAILDPKTGAYSITQNATIKHPAGGNENDAVFELKYQVKDGDGDIAVGRLWLKVDDDTPIKAHDYRYIDLQEADLGAQDSGSTEFKNNMGADGFGTAAFTGQIKLDVGPEMSDNISFNLAELGGSGHRVPSLTSDGQAITFLRVSDTLIRGVITEADGGAKGGTTIIELSLKGTDQSVSAKLYGPLDHVAAGSNAPIDLIRVDATVRFTDGDGDAITSIIRTTIHDGKPDAEYSGNVWLQEDAKSDSFVPVEKSGFFTFSGGADGASVTRISYGPAGGAYDVDNGTKVVALTSDGRPVMVTALDDLTLVGKDSNGTEVFRVQVIDVVTGEYKVTLSGPLDHPDAGLSGIKDALRMRINFTVQDGDGDVDNGHIQFDIRDDAPELLTPVSDYNLLTNGHFKAGDWQFGGWDGGFASSTVGWTISGTEPGQTGVQLEYANNDYMGMSSSNGGRMADLGATPGNTAISQTLTGLKTGAAYTLTFEMGSPDPASSGLEVYWNGEKLTVPGVTSKMQVVTLTGLVPDTDGKGVITFKEIGVADNTGTYLANISLAPANAADLLVTSAAMTEDGSVVFDADALPIDFGGDGLGKVSFDAAAAVIAGPAGVSLGKPDFAFDEKSGSWTIKDNGAFNGLPRGEIATITVPYTVSDSDGDGVKGLFQVTITGTNDAPTVTAEFDNRDEVYEKSLPGGSYSGDDQYKFATGTIKVADPDGLADITSVTMDGAGEGSETQSLEGLVGKIIQGAYGTLEITGYKDGEFTYRYTLTSAAQDLEDAIEKDVFSISVTDGLASSQTSIVIEIIDDLPMANNDLATISEDAIVPVTGNVLFNDHAGADAPKSLIGWTGTAQYGTFTPDSQGNWSYAVNPALVAHLDSGEKLTETLTYTIRDTDGDESSATLTITIDGANDAPTVTTVFDQWNGIVYEKSLPGGSQPGELQYKFATGTIKVGDLDGLDDIVSIKVDGAGQGSETQSLTGIVGKIIQGAYGSLAITGYENGEFIYRYTLSSTSVDTSAIEQDVFTISVSDGDASVDATISVEIRDDIPTVTFGGDDKGGVTSSPVEEGQNVFGNWTLVAGADGVAASHLRISFDDGSTHNVPVVYGQAITTAFGKLTLEAPVNGVGQWKFVANEVGADKSLTFTLSAKDGDGDVDSDAHTIKIANVVDPVLVVGSNAADDETNPNPYHVVPLPGGPKSGEINGKGDSDVLIGDRGGLTTTVEPGKNYNIALVVDASGSMNSASGTPGQTRMDLAIAALKNLATSLGNHDGVVNVLLVDLWDGADSYKFANVTSGNVNQLISQIGKLYAYGATNYEAAFNDAVDWFKGLEKVQPAGMFENVTFFLSDGDPTMYVNDRGQNVGNGQNTNQTIINESIAAFGPLAGLSDVHAIGIGSGVTKSVLRNFDNTGTEGGEWVAGETTTLSNFEGGGAWADPAKWTLPLNGGSVALSDNWIFNDYIRISDTTQNKGGAYTVGSPTFAVAAGAFATIAFDYKMAGANNGDTFAWKLQEFIGNKWVDHDGGSGLSSTGSFSTITSGRLDEGTYRFVFTVNDRTDGFWNPAAELHIDNVTLTPQTYRPFGEVDIVNTAGDLKVALEHGSSETTLAAVGADVIDGKGGNDVIFGDVANTDVLAKAAGLTNPAGSGWQVFLDLEAKSTGPSHQDLAKYLNAGKWDRASTLEYLSDPANREALAKESTLNGVGRAGGDDVIKGGAGNDAIFGQEGDDKLDGEGGNDFLSGGSGDDILIGGDGDDILIGGLGNDTLTGGKGADTFVFGESGAANADTITDYLFGDGDAVDLTALLSNVDITKDNIGQHVQITSSGNDTVISVDNQIVATLEDVSHTSPIRILVDDDKFDINI